MMNTSSMPLRTALLVITIATAALSRAQQDPMYSMYMWNMLSVQPGYAGSADVLNATALSRVQWAAINGAPVTHSLSAHAPINMRSLGAGGSLVHDRIGGVVVPWPVLFGTVPPATGTLWVQQMCALLVDGEVPTTTTLVLTLFMDQRLALLPPNPSWNQVRPHARALASLVLRLPEAQLH